MNDVVQYSIVIKKHSTGKFNWFEYELLDTGNSVVAGGTGSGFHVAMDSISEFIQDYFPDDYGFKYEKE